MAGGILIPYARARFRSQVPRDDETRPGFGAWADGPLPVLQQNQGSEDAAVNARFLLAFFDSVYGLALTVWVGSNLFFAFGVAPIVAQVLGPEASAKLTRILYPRYYTWGRSPGRLPCPPTSEFLELPGVPRPRRRVAVAPDCGGNSAHALRGQLLDPGPRRRARPAPPESCWATDCTVVR